MEVISYKCPNCDGELIFDPATQKYLCEYCISNFSQEELEKMEPDTESAETVTESAAEAEGEAKEAVMYTCPSCGAEIVTDETTAAAFCYYCHNPVVLSGKLSGDLMPDYVIPFQIDRETAEKKFLEFVGKKKFVPKAFFNKKQIERMSGVYFPYWLYDCRMESEFNASARKIRIWRTGSTEYTETKNFHLKRKGSVSLANLPKNALKKVNCKLAEGVFPYHMSEAKEFHLGYLSGFFAERRDIESAVLADEVRREVRAGGSLLMKDTIGAGYTAVQVSHEDYQIAEERWKYVLLPVWTVTYRSSSGKVYYYSMNGQTGNIVGELPVDSKKLCGLGGLIGAAVLVLGLIGGLIL